MKKKIRNIIGKAPKTGSPLWKDEKPLSSSTAGMASSVESFFDTLGLIEVTRKMMNGYKNRKG